MSFQRRWIFFITALLIAGCLAHEHHHNHHHEHDHDHEHSHDEHHHKSAEEDCPFMNSKISKSMTEESNLWFQALQATTTITLGGNAVIMLLFYFNITDKFLSRMVSFAVGGLLGDVFLHLIPHAILAELEAGHKSQEHEEHGHDHHGHDAFNSIGLGVLSGIIAFYTVERLLNLLNPQPHGHSHSKSDHEKKEAESLPLTQALLKPGVILNLTADFAHNFTDGLALAAAYRLGESLGFSMMLAVTLHEIPHEVGDFAVLLSQGLSKKAAFGMQFVSALGAYAGCVVGILGASFEPSTILAFTAGGFIYVGLAGLIPDLVQKEYGFLETCVQVVMMSLGVTSMLLVGAFEESAHDHNH